MSEHYHDVGDLRFLKEMGELAPTEFNAWLALDKIVGREDGAIPRKYRELIALGVAFTTQCPYCIECDSWCHGAEVLRPSLNACSQKSRVAFVAAWFPTTMRELSVGFARMCGNNLALQVDVSAGKANCSKISLSL